MLQNQVTRKYAVAVELAFPNEGKSRLAIVAEYADPVVAESMRLVCMEQGYEACVVERTYRETFPQPSSN